MPSAREAALAAFRASPEEVAKREAEEQRQREARERDKQVKRESKAFLVKAYRKVQAVLDIDATGWTVVESHPTYAVLQDPNDKAYHKLTLTVTTWGPQKRGLIVRYAPDKDYGKNYTNDRSGAGMDWHCGPVIEGPLALGKALAKHEAANQAYYKSLPRHMP